MRPLASRRLPACLALFAAAAAWAEAPPADAPAPAPAPQADAAPDENPMPPALRHTMTAIDGEPVDLAQYHGQAVLIVNVASKCGYTKQYADLQKLYETYADRGLVVLGFPCNQFGNQEPGEAIQIAEFCRTTYGVTFPMFAKIDVNGDAAAPLYAYLTGDDAPIEDRGPVKWNFEKFLLGRDGQVVARFRSKAAPLSEPVVAAIEAALGPAEAPAEGDAAASR